MNKFQIKELMFHIILNLLNADKETNYRRIFQAIIEVVYYSI